MWLISQEAFRALQRGEESGRGPTAEQQTEYEASMIAVGDVEAAAPRNMIVADGVAEIRVEGILTQKPDLFARWFGGGNTTYRDIQQALAMAAADPSVKRASLYVDSPGGTVDGVFDTIEAIHAFQASGKGLAVRARRAESAAYLLAAVAGKITAINAGAEFGSIGVAVSALIRDDIVTLTNSESPDKRPDLKTEEGKRVVVRYLDSIHKMSTEAIAAGRGVSVDDVNENFGRGATMLAGDAKKRGMIDAIVKPALRAVKNTATKTGGQERIESMDLATLKREHPEVYAEAVSVGAKAERERVNAHLRMGKTCGATELAAKAIEEGTDLGPVIQAEYMAAMANRQDRGARAKETAEAGAALEGTAKPAEKTEDARAEECLAELRRLKGIDASA
jgi:ClpP class serine protease